MVALENLRVVGVTSECQQKGQDLEMAVENDLIGKRIGNYHLIEWIGSGSSSTVYRALHIHLTDRVVALKVLHKYLPARERERFIRVSRIFASLRHPHILSIVDIGFDDNMTYLVSEYALGGSQRDRLNQTGLLPWDQALSILMQVGGALHYAHQQNIVHCNLKPENILFNAQGKALLADSSIAVVLSSTTSIEQLDGPAGTPPYMAPEQFRGQVSKETDQYALGCIAYELITGQRPFSAPDFISMCYLHLTEQPTPPNQINSRVAVHVEEAVLKALAKQRSDRHRDISAFLKALQTTKEAKALVGVAEAIPREINLAPPSAKGITPEQIITSLPKDIQDAAVFGETAPLRRALHQIGLRTCLSLPVWYGRVFVRE
jgi:serine/threonine protein kinase